MPRAALVLLLLALVAPTVTWAEGAEFLIETITVEGALRAAPGLIVSESLLVAGRTYSEDQLRLGVYRVKRLPFILDARFSLRKGSERGRYELVIEVREPHRVFFGLDTTVVPQESWSGIGRGAVGLRTFVGANGVAFVALEGDELRAGYTHYNLFERRIFASIEYGRQDECCTGGAFHFGSRDLEGGFGLDDLGFEGDSLRFSRPGDRQEQIVFTVGVPLGKSHALRFKLDNQDVESTTQVRILDFESGGFRSVEARRQGERQEAELRWLYDTTDNPVVPSRGRLLTVAVAGVEDERSLVLPGGDGIPAATTVNRSFFRSFETRAAMRQYWPLPGDQTISLAWEAAASRLKTELVTDDVQAPIESNLTELEGEAWVGYARSLWPRERTRRYGDLRLEIRVSHGAGIISSTVADSEVDFFSKAEIGVVYRSDWGVFRFRLFYSGAES